MATELDRGAAAAFQAADGTGVGIILRDKADRALRTGVVGDRDYAT